jgi:hypothetical protein
MKIFISFLSAQRYFQHMGFLSRTICFGTSSGHVLVTIVYHTLTLTLHTSRVDLHVCYIRGLHFKFTLSA